MTNFNDESKVASSQLSPLVSSSLPPLAEGSRRIYLLRHGETDWNLQGKIQGGGFDIPLNDNGKAQAQAVAAALKDIPIGVVASSHLARAKETADLVWSQHKETVGERRVVAKGFGEMRFGDFEGLAWRTTKSYLSEQFKAVAQQMKADIMMAFPGGGESTWEVAQRSVRALESLLDDYPQESHIAVVAHGRLNKVLISATALRSEKSATIHQGNTCINVMDVDAKGVWTARLINYVEHVKDNVIIR